MFGFDILIDDNLKPWLIEVNLAPSLDCGSDLDFNIKSNLITDLLNIVLIKPKETTDVNIYKQNDTMALYSNPSFYKTKTFSKKCSEESQ